MVCNETMRNRWMQRGIYATLLIATCILAFMVLMRKKHEKPLPFLNDRNGVKRFMDDDFFKQEEDEDLVKRDEEINIEKSMDSFHAARKDMINNMTSIFDGKLQSFPANAIMIQAMYRLMKPGGELSKEGFTRWGYIKRNGEARLILSRAFKTEKELLNALEKSTGLHLTGIQIAVGNIDTSKPLVALTNYIISLQNLNKLKDWLSAKFALLGEHVRHTLKGERVRVVIEYSCCSKTNNPVLGPIFGTFRVRVG